MDKDNYYKIRNTQPPELVKPSIELTSLGERIDEICDVSLFYQPGVIYTRSLSRAIKQSKKYLEERFRFHQVLIHYQKNILFLTRHSIGFNNPFTIPINKLDLDNDDIFTGTGLEIQEVNDLILFSGINMGKKGTNLTGSQYVHEITHTQLESMPGVLELYNHNEVLSILIELIYAFETDTKLHALKAFEEYRALEIVDGIERINDKEKDIDASIYLTSDIIALNLFILYYNSSNNIKREMIQNIQKVFDGLITVEEFMGIYDITFTNCLTNGNIEKHLKRQGR